MKENKWSISRAEKTDADEWMSLVEIIKDDFPGLNKEEYKKILFENIDTKTALCAKVKEHIRGILLFSLRENTLSFLAVHPEYRGLGIASGLIKEMTKVFPENSKIWVTTYREGDNKGEAARILYKKIGFIEDELIEVFDYPCQKFVLYVNKDNI